MMSAWKKNWPSEHLRRNLTCSEYRVDDTHTVMIMKRDNCHDCYVMEQKPGELGTPFLFMFGTPIGQMTYNQLVDMTIRVAPDYYYLFDD